MPASETPKIVVIGASAAGLKAAARARRLLPAAEVTVLDERSFISYGACGLPYFLSGDVDSLDALRETMYGAIRDPDFFAKAKGLDVRTGLRVESVDAERRVVTAVSCEPDEGDSEDRIEFSYDRLVLATGAAPRRLPGAETRKAGAAVSCFHTPEDARALRQGLQTGQIGGVIVVGAGFIGCELAGAFSELWGCEVTLIEAADSVLPELLDADMAELVAGELQRNDVTVRTGAAVERIVTEGGVEDGAKAGDGDLKAAVFAAGETLRADRAVIAAGVTPRVDLAAGAGLEVGPCGGLVVNERLQTSRPDIYAAGDCIEVVHGITGQPVFVPLGSLANRQGRVVGDNLAVEHGWKGVGAQAGAGSMAADFSRFGPVVGSACVKIFDWNVAVAGITATQARRAGLEAREAFGTFFDTAHYYPEHGKLFLKLVYEEGTQRLLGLQAVGDGQTVKRADVFAALLQRGGKLEDLLDLEFCYAPPYNAALDPLHALGCTALNVEETGIAGLGPDATPDGRFVVDVRLAEEITDDQPSPPGAKNIPIQELRSRVDELPRDKPLLILCAMGTRSAEAARWLMAQGFTDIVYLAGGAMMQAVR